MGYGFGVCVQWVVKLCCHVVQGNEEAVALEGAAVRIQQPAHKDRDRPWNYLHWQHQHREERGWPGQPQ
jgi:hypothetical protein